MVEAVGLAASIIAIVELTAKVGKLCYEYGNAVKDAPKDIRRLQNQLKGLGVTLVGAQKLIQGPNGSVLATSETLLESLDDCGEELENLRARLDDGKPSKTMRRLGMRSLKWPFQRKEVDTIITHLERYGSSIHSALQVDQTAILLDIRQGQRVSESKSQACFMIPFATDPHFIDRPDITKWLTQKYRDSWSRLALIGMGGFGKSQLAIHFAHNIRDLSPQTNIFWVNAATETSFEQSYRSIADRLDLPGRKDPQVDVLKIVYDHLQRDDSGPCLMILDNADDAALFTPNTESRGSSNLQVEPKEDESTCGPSRNLALFLPKRSQSLIMVTTRSKTAAERLTESHHAIRDVSTMEPAEAFQMLKVKVVEDFNPNEGAQLVEALGCIPLAITQAAAYINSSAAFTSVKAYLENFRSSDENKQSLLNKDNGDLRRDPGVSNSVVITWQVTFDQIRKVNPSAADLLTYMSVFQPQKIPMFALGGYQCSHQSSCGALGLDDVEKPTITNLGGCFNYGRFQRDLGLLMSYSLVSVTAKKDFCDLHPLVQFCTQTWSATFGDWDTCRQTCVKQMADLFLFKPCDDFSAYRMLCPHIRPLLGSVGERDASKWLSLLKDYVSYQMWIGNARKMQGLVQGIIDANPKLRNSKDSAADRLQLLLLESMLAVGDRRALEFGLKLVQTLLVNEGKMKTELQINLMWTATYATVLCLGSAGRFEEAANAWTQLLDAAQQACGPEHPRTMAITLELAEANMKLGPEKLKEAEKQIIKLNELNTARSGVEDSNTITGMYLLAKCYLEQNQFKETEKLCLRLMELDSSVLPYTSRERTACVSSLSRCYEAQNQLEKAELTLSQAIDKLREIRQGGLSLGSALLSFELGQIWDRLNRLDDVRELYSEILEFLQKTRYEDHRVIAEIQAWLEYVERKLRKRTEDVKPKLRRHKKTVSEEVGRSGKLT